MDEIGVFSPEQARQLWQWYLQSVASGAGSQDRGPRPLGSQADYCVILDAALAAATNSKTGATSALAKVCTWDATTKRFSEVAYQITVYNHSESTSHAKDTFGVARFITGHWWFFGDCDAMKSRGSA